MNRTWLAALLIVPATAFAGGPTLDISGACPGTIDVMASGFAPGATVGVLRGAGPGADIIPGGPCAGLPSDLGGLSLITTARADGAGRIVVSPSVGGPLCGDLVQMVDTSSCSLTNTAVIGGGGGPGVIYVAEGRNGAGSEFGVVDLATGAYLPINPAAEYSLTGLSFAPDGDLYGVEASGRSNPAIVRVDPASGVQAYLSMADDPGSFSAFAFASDGMLYGWTESGDDFLSIDPISGATALTSVSIGTANNCMAEGPDGLMYMLSGSNLYTIDPMDPAGYVSMGSVSGLDARSGGGCTFHEGMLYKSANASLYAIDLATMVATDLGIVLPANTDAI
ncbi:MAG: hypothetical protein ACI9K2_004386, partial [Myxococcota bacterium]